ncbi:MAG: transposase [Bacteroidetes bacterium]|nr:transposase [Bacteroidota bacterium]
MHILPPRFMKIRHYGFLSNRGSKTKNTPYDKWQKYTHHQ